MIAKRALRSRRMVQEGLKGTGSDEEGISSERIAVGGRCHETPGERVTIVAVRGRGVSKYPRYAPTRA